MERKPAVLQSKRIPGQAPPYKLNRTETDMSTTTWTQYIAMDDAGIEPGMFEAALDSLEDWDDDFDIGVRSAGESAVESLADLDDPE